MALIKTLSSSDSMAWGRAREFASLPGQNKGLGDSHAAGPWISLGEAPFSKVLGSHHNANICPLPRRLTMKQMKWAPESSLPWPLWRLRRVISNVFTQVIIGKICKTREWLRPPSDKLSIVVPLLLAYMEG